MTASGGSNSQSEALTGSVDGRHRQLVETCIAQDDDFRAAVDHCMQACDPDELDLAGRELLPLIFRRMLDSGYDHSARGRLSYFYRTTWHHNHLLLYRARSLFEKLGEMGTRPVVLKGGALLSSAYHDDLGVRAMADIDMLIEPGVVEPVVQWALESGWRVAKGFELRDVLAAHHAVDLVYGDSGAVDLHWSLLVNSRDERRDAELIGSSRPARLGDIDIWVLDATHQLLHTAAHVKPSGIRHLIDAVTVIKADGASIDWDMLIDEVIARRVVANTLRTLRAVDDLSPRALPSGVIERLETAPRHWSDYVYHGEPLRSRTDVIRRFAADVSSRSRGSGPIERLRVARAMAHRYGESSGMSIGATMRGLVFRGAEAIKAESTSPNVGK